MKMNGDFTELGVAKTDTLYFELLIQYPRLQVLEPSSSYLARLAIANGIKTLSDLAVLFYPDGYRNIVYWLKDYPPPTFGKLAVLTNHSEDKLLAATFYHLARKFNRTISAAVITKFLADCISPYLRYCPICLEQSPYYSLSWRFSALKGCVKHSCWLLDKCESCQEVIPLFNNPITFGVCPKCSKQLKTSPTKPMSKRQMEATLSIFQDLEFLLLPHSCEDLASIVLKQVGEQLRSLRLLKHQSIGQVEKQLKIRSGEILFAEEGRTSNGNASFKTYLDYANYLEVSLLTLFKEVYQN